MMRRFVPARAALAAAVLLALCPAAEAQFRGGGGRGMSYGRGAYYGGGGYGGYYPGGGGYGNYAPGWGYGNYYPGAYVGSTGYATSPGMGYGYSGVYQPYQQYGMATPGYVQPYAATPGTPTTPTTPAPGATTSSYPPGTSAKLTVKLPAPDAQVWVDNWQPQMTGAERMLTTPPLQPGQTYHYTVKAQWNDGGRPVTQERRIDFQAGQEVTVDFTQPAPPTTPPASSTPTTPPASPAPG
jgi:uncharacterized protein (TIGR03000 family)